MITAFAVCAVALCIGAMPGDTTADAVLGQPGFQTNVPNQPDGAPTAGNMAFAFAPGVAVAPGGRLYVADDANHRVLSWSSATAYSNGDAADLVLGQADFTHGDPNRGGAPAADSFYLPQGVAVDELGDLWVTDAFNHRVLKFIDPAHTDGVADLVLGQPDFTSAGQNGGLGELSATELSLNYPGRVLPISEGRLVVADSGNSRLLYYPYPTTNQAEAGWVLGQFGDFNSSLKNNDGSGTCINDGNTPCGPPSADNLFNPIGLALDRAESLYVADWVNNRVLRFDQQPVENTGADAVIGQGDFVSGGANSGGLFTGLNMPTDVAVDKYGRLFIADSANHRVIVYPPGADGDAVPLAVFGQLGDFTTNGINHGLGDVLPDADGLYGPTGLALDASGSLYIVDASNSRLLRFDGELPPPVPSDQDFDQDVDGDDFARWFACNYYTYGPDGVLWGFPACIPADSDFDGDVDLRDAARLFRCFGGSEQAPNAGCFTD